VVPLSRREPPKVRLTRRIDSTDQLYLLWVNELPEETEHLGTVSQTEVLTIPDEFSDLAEAFSKAKAHELPPHRGPLDHHIPLEKDSKPVFGPIYNLSEKILKEKRAPSR
jgi:hypothetical protein